LVVFASGLSVMVLELVAGRLVAPYFGQSTVTWAALSGVTLAGVTAGNALGGWLSNRTRKPGSILLTALLAGGLLTAVLPVVLPAIGVMVSKLGDFRLQTAIFVTLAWFPPMLALGCVTPSVAAICVDSGRNGRDLGRLYLASMLGSAIGSVLGGLVLPFVWPTDALYVFFGSVLALAAGASCFVRRADGENGEIGDSSCGSPDGCGSPALWFIAVFAVGWFGMGFEFAGIKLVTPILGGNHIVWSLVFVTFIGMMGVGGEIGGRLADRFARIETAVYSVLLLVATGFATIWAETRLLPSLLDEAGTILRLAAFTVFAFAPVALVLGGTSTILLKFATADALRRGNRGAIGMMYATVSAGCVCGTFITGFALVGRFTSTDICMGLIAGLAFLAFAISWRSGARWGRGSHLFCPTAVVAALALAWLGGRSILGRSWADGLVAVQIPVEVRNSPGVRTLSVADSRYNVVTVSELRDSPNIRTIWLDRIPHTSVDMRDRTNLQTSYTRMIDIIVGEIVRGRDSPSLFMIGGGGYALPRKWTSGRTKWDRLVIAEIDEAVTDMAVRFLDAGPMETNGVEYATGDGRRIADDLLADGCGRFDVAVGDTISDSAIPYHLATREFNDRIKALLKPDGAYLLHTLDRLDDPCLLASLLKTMSATWRHIEVLGYQQLDDVRQSFIVIASDDPAKTQGADYARALQREHPDSWPIVLGEGQVVALCEREGALLLTDRFAPMERYVWDVVFRASDKSAEGDSETALQLLRDGRQDEALDIIKSILARVPEFPDAIRALRSYLETRPDDEEAADILACQASRRSAGSVAQAAYASFLAQKGNVSGAERELRRLRDRFPKRADFAKGWLINATRCGMIDEAKAWLDSHKRLFGTAEIPELMRMIEEEAR